MWQCRNCETLNNKSECIVCGDNLPKTVPVAPPPSAGRKTKPMPGIYPVIPNRYTPPAPKSGGIGKVIPWILGILAILILIAIANEGV